MRDNPGADQCTVTTISVLLTFLVVGPVGWLWLCSVCLVTLGPSRKSGPSVDMATFVAEGMSERLSHRCTVSFNDSAPMWRMARLLTSGRAQHPGVGDAALVTGAPGQAHTILL